MERIEKYTQRRPQPQHTLLPRLFLVEPKNANRRIVQPIKHICARREIIQFFSDVEVPRVENHAERPTRQAHVSKEQIVISQRVGRGYVVADLGHAPRVREVVEEGEDDGEGLLHAEEAVEGPFAVELVDVRVEGERGGGYDVLAGVVAFGGAGPEEEAAVECYTISSI